MNQITELPLRERLIRSADRCDRCGAEALVRIVLTSTRLPLLFCGHHYSQSATALHNVAVVTHDDRLTGDD
jgi:hypothetical protein